MSNAITKYLSTIIGILSLQAVLCQTKDKLIEYLPGMEPTVTARATIFMPSFQKLTNDTPQIVIKRKGDVWIELYYRYRPNTGNAKDTCYIATLTQSHKTYYESAGMQTSQVMQKAELPCFNAGENCNFIISTTETHFVRFRVERKTKTYKLLVTD